jgi:hypothetical protein
MSTSAPQQPSDLEILAYEQSIKDQEAKQHPLVSDQQEALEVLKQEYADNPGFLAKLKVL